MSWQRPSKNACPKCGKYMLIKGKKVQCSDEQCGYVKELEDEMLEKINALGIGPAGLGGDVTALAVNIETYPTHIAGLPVAINMCCHVNRHSSRVLKGN